MYHKDQWIMEFDAISEGYPGILSRDEAFARLKDLGFVDCEAEMELTILEEIER